MVKRSQQFLVIQKVVLGFVGLAVLVIGGYLMSTLVTESVDGEFVEGRHYTVLESPRRTRGDKVEVMEVFAYSCIHCNNFDPLLNNWAEENADIATVVRSPSVAGESARILAHGYFALQSLGLLENTHEQLFAAIHSQGQRFSSAEDLADWVDGKGATREAFLAAFNASNTKRRVAAADMLARQAKVFSIPSVIVAGKYMVTINREVGQRRLLQVVSHLIEKERNPQGETTAG